LLTDLFGAVGGIQTFNRGLVKALDETADRRGWKVTLLVLNDRRKDPCNSRYFSPERTRYKAFNQCKTSFTASALRHSRHASILIIGHVHFAPLCLGVRLIRPEIQILLMVYGQEVWKRLSIFQRLGVERTTRVLSISAYTRDQMALHNNLEPGHFGILPCALDPFYGEDATNKSREDLSLPHGKMILSVARLEVSEQKGIDRVIEMLPAVVQRVPDVFFVVIGEGTNRPRLQELAREVGVREKVIFVGRVSDDLLQSYYQACDVFALPSLLEGFGIVFLEAMFEGKPCVGVRAGAIPEVIQDGITGFLCKPGDSKALADALTGLLTNEHLSLDMGEAGKERLEREFSFRAFQTRVEASLDRR